MADWQLGLMARLQRSIEGVAGVRLIRGRAACPLCLRGAARAGVAVAGDAVAKKARKGRAASDSFSVRGERWDCFRCGQGGDVIDLEQALRGGTAVEAARRLVGDLPAGVTPEPVNRQVRPEGPSATAEIAAQLWRDAGPFAGSIGEAYLESRDIAGPVIAAAAGNMRFHRRARWWFDRDRGCWIHAPAMIQLVVTAGPDGRAVATGGVHATYLASDGRGKAESDDANAKIMWGPQARDGRPGGAWLIGPGVTGAAADVPAVGAEGVESALSMASLAWRASGVVPRTWAALSLDRLQGRLLRDDDRRVDVWNLTPDPARPAFTWPGIDAVEIGVDRDMKPLMVQARTGRGKPCDMTLDGEARARMCARMAAAAWKAAGSGTARAVAPRPGQDFNDYWRAMVARQGGAA